jgi:hypothetical protein
MKTTEKVKTQKKTNKKSKRSLNIETDKEKKDGTICPSFGSQGLNN